MKVIIISQKDEFDSQHIEKIGKYAEVVWLSGDQTNISEVSELFDDEEKIVGLSPVPLNWKISTKIYQGLKNVKYICLPTTAFDFIDLKKTKFFGIKVTNVPYYSTNAVAEYALFMLMALIKKFPNQLKSGFKYEFTKQNLMDELRGKIVGIAGLGHIGSRIAEIMNTMGSKVVYWSRGKKNNKYDFLSLEDLIVKSDFVFPAYTLNQTTKNLLNRRMLLGLKTSAYFVNIVGEEACDTGYLLNRVENNQLAGLAFESQRMKMIEKRGNVFITAPIAWYTKQSLANNIDIWTNTIISCVKGSPINLVG